MSAASERPAGSPSAGEPALLEPIRKTLQPPSFAKHSCGAAAGTPPEAGYPDRFLVVGKIRRPHGVAGEALVEIYTGFPERLAPKTMIFVGAAHQPLTIRKHRPHKDGLLLAFEDITTPEQVGLLRNQMISIPAADRPPLPEGEYYHHQILGLSVVDEDGQELGKLAEILETGANDVYVVRRDDPQYPKNGYTRTGAGGIELLLPAISDVVLDVDLPRKTMRVHLLPGLVEEGTSDESTVINRQS